MADNENFSANIEVNVDLNTKAAEAKVAELAKKIKAIEEQAISLQAGSGQKFKRPSKGSGFLEGDNLTAMAAAFGKEIKDVNNALFKGIKTGIDQLDSLAQQIKDAGYRLDIVAKTGQVQLVRSKTNKEQQSTYLSKQKFEGADQIASSSAILGAIDATKLRQQILKELSKLGFTGIKDYIVGQVKAATEEQISSAVHLEGIDGMSWADDVSKINADFINENAKRITKFIGKQFTEGQDFLETGMATHLQGSTPVSLTKKNIMKPGVVNPDQLAASSDFVAGKKGVPILSAEIFALATEMALANIHKATPADFGIAQKELNSLMLKVDKALYKHLKVYNFSDAAKGSGTEFVQNQINTLFEPGNFSGSSKRGQTPKLSQAEQNKRLIEQFNILSPQSKITSFDDIIQEYFAWVIENKIVPSLEATAHKSVKKMSQGKSRYNDMLSAGDQGAENFQEYQQRAVTAAIPGLTSKYGIDPNGLAQDAGSWKNTFIADMVKIAAVSGEVAAAMGTMDDEFFKTEEHLRNFNAFLNAQIEAKLPESGMNRRELGRAAKDANKSVATTVVVDNANTVVDAQLEALRKVYKGDKMQQMKNIIGAESFDKIFAFLADTLKAGGKLGDVIAGWDTEYGPALDGISNSILESSVVLRNAQGNFADVQTFMHRPAYLDPQSGLGGVAGLNKKLGTIGEGKGVNSINAFMKRANDLGIPESELGNIKDFKTNTAEASKKFMALQSIFVALHDLRIPLVGQNVLTADFGNFKKTLDWLNTVTEQIHLVVGYENVTDNFAILKRMRNLAPKSDPGMAIAGIAGNAKEGIKGTDLGQSAIIQALFKKFPSEMEKYSKFIQPTQNGFKVTIDGKDFTAHTAQADAVASIIVNQVMQQISPAFASLMQGGSKAYLTDTSKARGSQFPYSTEAMKKSEIKVNMVERAAEADDLVRATRSEDQAQRELVKSMAGMSVAVPLFEHIRAIISGTAGDTQEANNALKSLLNSMREMLKVQAASFSGKRLNSVERVELERINKLQAALNDLHDVTISKGNKVVDNGLQLKKIQHLISGEYSKQIDEVEKLRKLQEQPKQDKTSGKGYYTLGNAVMQPFEQAQAGPVFGKEIQSQMKEYVTREKQVESANKNLINTWVTARYALYDVANAYQNVSRNLMMATRAMFNMTQSYRSFETAFTPVERAMSLQKDEVIGLRDQFVALSEQIPVSFQDLSSVATLGAQMGITAEGIVKFTDTVTKFASVTGVSADTVAQKFGRIAQLTKLDPAQFENLASSISYAGVNAVATEAEIMALAESISAVSNRVGVLAPEVIGLSTSLASLGIAPEQARGVFTRVFADIDRAVSKGGTQLDNFSKVSGMSSANFKKQWGTPGQSYEVFRRILEGLNKSGKDMTQTFDDLNLTETREVNTLTRLATNLDVVDQSMVNAKTSFSDNVFLSDSFAKTVDNLDSKLKIFQNSIDALAASLSKGFAAGLGTLLDVGSALAKMFETLANNQIIQFMTSGIAGALALGAAGSAMVSIMAKVVAQIYAFRVANINAANDPTAVTGFARQIKALTNYKNEIIEMRDQITKSETSSSIRGQITPINYPVKVMNKDYSKYLLEQENIYRATGVAAIKAATQEEAAAKLRSMSAFEALTMARVEADQINHLVAVRQNEITVMERYVAAQVESGAMSAENAALIMREVRARQIHYTWVNGEAQAVSLDNEMKAAGIGISSAVVAAEQKEAAARLVNTNAMIAETRAGAVGKGSILTGAGSAVMGIASGAMVAISAATTLYMIFELIRGSIEESSKFNLLEAGGGLASLRESVKKDTAEFEKTGVAIRTVTNELDNQSEAVNQNKVKIGELIGIQDDLNTNIATGSDQIKTQTLAIGENTKAWIANALIQDEQLQKTMEANPNMLQDLQNVGVDFKQLMSDILSGKNVSTGIESKIDSVNKKMSDITGKASSTGTALTASQTKEFTMLSKQLTALGVAKGLAKELKTSLKSATQQTQVSSIINQILGIDDPTGLDTAVKKTVERIVRTLTDYSGDVGKVFNEMLRFKFQKQNSFGDLRGVIDGVNKGIKDTEKSLRDLTNTLEENSQKRKRLEVSYQLAVQFGDTDRAKKVANEMASLDAEIANNQEDIQYNTDKLSGSLDVNTQAGRDNDKALQGIISSNAAYIQTLIDSGASTDVINKAVKDGEASFRAQATAMNISQNSINKYAKAFDGFKKIIKGMPKVVTVDADTDPAKRALEEFLAQANNSVVEVVLKTKTESQGTETTITKGLSDGAKLQDLKAKRDMYYALAQDPKIPIGQRINYATLASEFGNKYVNFMAQLNKAGKGKMNVSMLAAGGYISGSGSGTSDSIPAMLSNGEYVINSGAVKGYGLDFMNALNQQRVGMAQPQYAAASSANNADSVVYLSSRDRELLQAAIDRPVTLRTTNRVIAESANDGNKELARRGAN